MEPDPADRWELRWQGSLLDGLHRLVARLTLRLQPGLFHFPLGDGPPLQLEVREGSSAFLRLETSRDPDDRRPMLQTADLHFDPPLTLSNVLQTLRQLQAIAPERHLALLPGIGNLLPAWVLALGTAALGTADASAAIQLEAVSLRPEEAAGEPVLRPRFSGRVRWFDRLETAFARVILPVPILPLPSAALERLLSAAPLASARLAGSIPQPIDLLRSLLELIPQLTGDLQLELTPPHLQVSDDGPEGPHRLAEIAPLAGPLSLRGPLRATVTPASLALVMEELHLRQSSAGSSVPTSVRLRLTGEVTLDLEPGDLAPRDRVSFALRAQLRPGSRLAALELALSPPAPPGESSSAPPPRRVSIEPEGCLTLELNRGALSLRPPSTIEVRALVAPDAPSSGDRGTIRPARGLPRARRRHTVARTPG